MINKRTRSSHRICLFILAASMIALLWANLPSHADQQNMLSPITDDASWHLAVAGKAKATIARNDDVLVCSITATDGNQAHVEISHSGMTLAEGHTYLLSFEGRSAQAFALKITAATDHKPARNVGLDETVYLTPHWSPYRTIFTAKGSTPKHVVAPLFLLGRDTGTVFLRNATLVPLAGLPPVDAGLPAPAQPLAREIAYSGSIRSLLPNSAGFVMWVTGKTAPSAPPATIEPPHIMAVYQANAHITLGATTLLYNSVKVGDLVSATGIFDKSGTALIAREIHLSHGYLAAPITYTPPVPQAMKMRKGVQRRLRSKALPTRRAASSKRTVAKAKKASAAP